MTSTRKIFIIIPWFSPAYKAGGPIQSVLNLVNRTTSNVEYSIFCGNREIDGTINETIQSDCWQAFNAQTQVYYCSEKTTDQLKKQVHQLKPDVIFIIGIFSYSFNIFPLLFIKHPQKILSVRGMLHPGALSQKSLKKRLFLSFFRSMGLQNNIRFHATDSREQSFVEEIFGKKIQVEVAGNYPALLKPIQRNPKETGYLQLITVALISPMKNHLEVLKALSICRADITYHIVGAVKDPGYWSQCEELIHQLPSNIQVKVHGEQPPSTLLDFLSQADVMIMPSKSENFAHALIEGLSSGLPVITSKYTPWNELEMSSAGFNLDIDSIEISKAINQFAEMNTSAFESWKTGAIEYARKSIDMKKLDQQYQALFS